MSCPDIVLLQTSSTSWVIHAEPFPRNILRELEFAWELASTRRVMADRLRAELGVARSNESYYKKVLERNDIRV